MDGREISNLLSGGPAPVFKALSPGNPEFAFSSLGGHWVLLAFTPSPGPLRDAAITAVLEHSQLFSNGDAVCFLVVPDEPSMEAWRDAPPLRWFGDPDGEIRRLYDCEDDDGKPIPRWVIIDPSQRIWGWAALERAPEIFTLMAQLGSPENHAAVPLHAPVLIVPRVFEPSFCQHLISIYEQHGGEPSGVLGEVKGRTTRVINDFKRRRDARIVDPETIADVRSRVERRLFPEIEKAFQFKATHVERYIVACYDAADGGYFRPHRDNLTAITAHRKFAVSINLNSEAFEGGDLRFPEFGRRTYRPPTGGAVVFSCSLLHEATPVISGVRYACLPFLFDEAGAEVRARNREMPA